MTVDMVNHPPHYSGHPSGVECIELTEWMNFCVGNAVKYLWRRNAKGRAVEDLDKAIWYVKREMTKIVLIYSNPIPESYWYARRAYLAAEPEGNIKDVMTLLLNLKYAQDKRGTLEAALALMQLELKTAIQP